MEKAEETVLATTSTGGIAVSKGLPKLGDLILVSYLQKVLGENGKHLDEAMEGYRTMRRELEGPNPTPLERLAVDRVAVCHAALHRTEMLIAFSTQPVSIENMDAYEDRISRLQTRYLQAVRALAQIRKLDLPNVQINIGEKQVNVGSLSGPAQT